MPQINPIKTRKRLRQQMENGNDNTTNPNKKRKITIDNNSMYTPKTKYFNFKMSFCSLKLIFLLLYIEF